MSPDTQTQVMAAMGFNPAWASPFNLFLLICLTFFAFYFARELKALREQVILQAEAMVARAEADAEEKVRIARGSEARAVNAAAEITRVAGTIGDVSGEMRAMRQEAEEALTAISLVGRAVHDRLVLLKIENDLRGDLREETTR